MTSPSMTTRSRNTPCVEGCCGPMFRTNGSVGVVTLVPLPGRRAARLAVAVEVQLVVDVEDAVRVLPVLEREPLQAGGLAVHHAQPVLAQRVAGEALPQQQAAQVRVSGETDAHQVVDLALLEQRALVD